ncbi:hypothetical protein [Nocardia asiatica]|uniref:hypothetical protein n=1 Tax=Nocardia asiatica TaxID=209252 RepID=UPI003EDE97F4
MLGQYPGLSWAQLVEPEYVDPDSIPELVEVGNKINMGLAPSPTIPMYVAQGTAGHLEGTAPGGPGIGEGDGIMVAGDTRGLLNRYCADGLAVQYHQSDFTSHPRTCPLVFACLPRKRSCRVSDLPRRVPPWGHRAKGSDALCARPSRSP